MRDLFATPHPNGERLDLVDADVVFASTFLSSTEALDLFSELREATPWKAIEISLWGKRVVQPRLICWYGDPGASYKYSGVRLYPEPWTQTLLLLRNSIERFAGASFNSVLMNLYRDENDSVGWHSDDEPDLGERPTLASLSLGETRAFLMRHKPKADVAQIKLPLPSGSLLVMSGETQRHWAHAIRKEPVRLGPRINLTFRQVVSGKHANAKRANR